MDGSNSHLELASGKLSLNGSSRAGENCVLCAEGVSARMARQFGLLERLGAVTIVLAEAVGQEAAKYPNSSGADAFVQVARSLRQTIALERRIDAEREAGARREAEVPRQAGAARHATAQDDAPDHAMDDAGRQVDDGEAAVPAEDLLRDLRERADRPDAADELRGLPSGEVVGRICQMLGIEADLSCFTDQEMGRRAAMNYPPPPKPPAPLSDAEFEAALARPSHRQLALLRAAGRRNPRSPGDQAAARDALARDAACGGGGHDPPLAVR